MNRRASQLCCLVSFCIASSALSIQAQTIDINVAGRPGNVPVSVSGIAPLSLNLGAGLAPSPLLEMPGQGGVSAPAMSLSPIQADQPASAARILISNPAGVLRSAPPAGPSAELSSGKTLPGGFFYGPNSNTRDMAPALHSAQALSAAGSAKLGASGGDKSAAAAAGFFDRNLRLGGDVGGIHEDPVGGGANGASLPLGSGNNAANPSKTLPRVVMILDTFSGPAPDDVVQYIDKLTENDVHVVFVTARPYSGASSAQSILMSRVKARMNNPVIVVSYNGAQVTPHTPSRSADSTPKSLIPNLEGFAPATLDVFRKFGDSVRSKFGIKEPLQEYGYPSLNDPYIYGAMLPKGVDADKWAAAYNRLLASANYRYKVEVGQDAQGNAYFFTQTTALRLNTPRIFQGLYAMFPRLNPANEPVMGLKSNQVIIFANPANAPTFLKTLDGAEMEKNKTLAKGTGFYLHGVQDWSTLRQGLGSILGEAAFEKIYVNRFDVRDYVEWREARQKFGPSAGMRGSGSGKTVKGSKGASLTPFSALVARYKGTIVKRLMDDLFGLMRNGSYDQATEEMALKKLRDYWNNPRAHGIFLDPEIEAAMLTPEWRNMNRPYRKDGNIEPNGPMSVAAQWVRNYYHRNFPNYPRGVDEQVAGKLVGLARDGKMSVNLHYTNPHTGQDFIVGVRLDRQEVEEDSQGYVLAAHVYRTGREPYFKDFDEGVETNISGRALLEAWAEKRDDGKWYLNGEPNPRVKLVFHYMTRDLAKMYTPEELEATTPQVTSIITQRQADPEYQALLAERQKREETAQAMAMKKLGREPKKTDKKK